MYECTYVVLNPYQNNLKVGLYFKIEQSKKVQFFVVHQIVVLKLPDI